MSHPVTRPTIAFGLPQIVGDVTYPDGLDNLLYDKAPQHDASHFLKLFLGLFGIHPWGEDANKAEAQRQGIQPGEVGVVPNLFRKNQDAVLSHIVRHPASGVVYRFTKTHQPNCPIPGLSIDTMALIQALFAAPGGKRLTYARCQLEFLRLTEANFLDKVKVLQEIPGFLLTSYVAQHEEYAALSALDKAPNAGSVGFEAERASHAARLTQLRGQTRDWEENVKRSLPGITYDYHLCVMQKNSFVQRLMVPIAELMAGLMTPEQLEQHAITCFVGFFGRLYSPDVMNLTAELNGLQQAPPPELLVELSNARMQGRDPLPVETLIKNARTLTAGGNAAVQQSAAVHGTPAGPGRLAFARNMVQPGYGDQPAPTVPQPSINSRKRKADDLAQQQQPPALVSNPASRPTIQAQTQRRSTVPSETTPQEQRRLQKEWALAKQRRQALETEEQRQKNVILQQQQRLEQQHHQRGQHQQSQQHGWQQQHQHQHQKAQAQQRQQTQQQQTKQHEQQRQQRQYEQSRQSQQSQQGQQGQQSQQSQQPNQQKQQQQHAQQQQQKQQKQQQHQGQQQAGYSYPTPMSFASSPDLSSRSRASSLASSTTSAASPHYISPYAAPTTASPARPAAGPAAAPSIAPSAAPSTVSSPYYGLARAAGDDFEHMLKVTLWAELRKIDEQERRRQAEKAKPERSVKRQKVLHYDGDVYLEARDF